MQQNAVDQARFNMIQQQIRPWEVLDGRVIAVLAEVPREHFVPEGYKGLAFADTEIPIGHGQHMMAPKVEGRLLQALDVRPGSQVLEIGTGSGYVTACLARLGGQVTSVEIHGDLLDEARGRLSDQGISDVELVNADGLAAIPDGPFDAIAVTGSLPMRDDRLRHHLKAGGRLFLVVGEPPVMDALLITRVGDNAWKEESLFETELAPLLNVPRPERFRF